MSWMVRTLVAVCLCAGSAGAQQVPAAVGAELQSMAGAAGVIFTGQVVEVSRNDAAGFVDVRFRIDEAVRGCPRTGWYVVREWAGLWVGEPDRYRVGQRRLMLLTARSASGFSSPVGGMDGAIPLVAAGAGPVADAAGVAPVDTALAPAGLAVDLRWIQARVVQGTIADSNASARVAHGGPALQAKSASGPVALAPVLAMLKGVTAHAWSEGGDARY